MNPLCVLAAASILMAGAYAVAGDVLMPLMPKAPTVDGKIDPAEWQDADAFEYFQLGGNAERRRAEAFVGATPTHLYVAIRSQLPAEGELLNATGNADSLKVVHDDSAEVYVNPTPDADDRVDYQFLTNFLGRGGYNVHILGVAQEDVAWQGGWQTANGIHDGAWHFECAIPLASMKTAGNRAATDGVWAVNLTRNWKNPWTWSSLSGGYANSGVRFRFTSASAPVVRSHFASDPFAPPTAVLTTVRNPSTQPLELAATVLLDRNRMPALRQEETFTLAPGATRELRLDIPENDPTTRYGLELTVASPDGRTVYCQRAIKWARGEADWQWVATGKVKRLPVDFKFAYYPYQNTFRLGADVRGLPEDAELTGLTLTIRDRLSGKAVTTLDIAPADLVDGQAERWLDLPPLDGLYSAELVAAGKNVPAEPRVQDFERQVFPWEHTLTGRSTKVYPPFTPIEIGAGHLRTVLRDHTLNGAGLWDQVAATAVNTGKTANLLAAPMRYLVRVGDTETVATPGDLAVASAAEHEVTATGGFTGGPLRATSATTWDYDGCMRVDLTLAPTAGQAVDGLTLEIPFAADQATYIHANADRIRAPIAITVPTGDGVVWDASKVACDEYPKNFCPYIFVGTPQRGICWFAENDLNWGWDATQPNLDIVRRDGQVVLRLHLINQPTVIDTPRTITFGLLAAPVKPRLSPDGPNWWRHRYYRDRYTLLGTDINWLSLGTCGSLKPAGGDLYFWEMIARGNRERLDRETMTAVVNRGLPIFEPYGDEAVESWRRHVYHNLTSRYGQKMVFYYNRASHQAAPEFETFKDEWALTDWREIGKGNGRNEIKIVPSASYIDCALYWYARSFEVGANHGVYWDNFFIAPSANTRMTAAYRRADGTLVPAAGIWEQRELAKRTFIMLNERGMLPITFPHMTSFSPLPMMAFATVQYDWEWKYSLGDVQDRHSREMILMLSTGELAGVWPVPLSDHGKLAADPWTQRTFLGVRLVHELDGGGGLATEELRHAQSLVIDLLDEPGLTVYRYWDDRPLPAATGDPDLPSIVYSLPGREALVGVTSYSREDRDAVLTIDPKALGLAPGYAAVNAETGEVLPVQADKIALRLPKHDLRLIRLQPAK